jgi:ATP-dependent Lon protease
MNLYKELINIFPYLVSIRKLENYVSIDIEFPKSWKYPKKYVDEKTIIEQKAQKEDVRFFSFATAFDETSLNVLFTNINGIVKYNKEREEKEFLLDEKMKQLRSFFEQNKLDDLKSLEFNIKSGFNLKLEDDGQSEDIGLVSEGA